MTSAVDICNMALGHLGSRAQVTSINPPDGSVEAGLCARFYGIARREALERGTWRWAKKRVSLGLATSNQSTEWTYAYVIPSDCIKLLKVLQGEAPIESPYFCGFQAAQTEMKGAAFDTEGQTLLTHAEDASLLYLADVTDTTKYSASFMAAVSYLLAAYLAGPVLKGVQGANAARTLRAVAATTISEADASDIGASGSAAGWVPDSLRAR